MENHFNDFTNEPTVDQFQSFEDDISDTLSLCPVKLHDKTEWWSRYKSVQRKFVLFAREE